RRRGLLGDGAVQNFRHRTRKYRPQESPRGSRRRACRWYCDRAHRPRPRIMLRSLLGLLGVDLDHKIAEIRAQIEDFKARTTYQLGEQVKETGLMVGFAFVGAVAAIAT